MAAAFAMLAGCAKTEMTESVSEGTRNISVSVKIDNGADTKAVFDGDGYIKFESGDGFYAAVAKPESPTTAVMVADSPSYEASIYASKFTISDATATNPIFNGKLYNIVEADFADEYLLYGLFPANYSSWYSEGWENLTSWTVEIPDEQKSTQTTWSEDADIMIIKPTRISTSDNTFNETYKEYTTKQSESIKFAHLFGFGKFTFEGVPEQYAGEVVKSVLIEAVGDNKDFTGKYKLDITKDIEDVVLTSSSTSASVTLKGDGKTTVADYVAWFVANPGTFDVKVTVETGKAALIFERQGLVIRRSEIAAPVINYKDADKIESHDVTLVDAESWQHTVTTTNALNYSNPSRVWGDGDKKMEFSVSYNSTNEHYGSYQSASSGKYVQLLSNNNEITGGEIILSSAASFKGIKMVKLNLGNATDGVTNDFTLKLVEGGNEYVLGKVGVTGSSKDLSGVNHYFSTTEGNENGQLVLVADNLSVKKCKPYIGGIVINPAPEIVFGESAIKVEKAAASGEVTCAVSGADADPVVTDDATWLETSYADGKISYTVEENTGSKRTATITVTATGLSETVATITVTQKSATAVECKLTVAAADMWKLISAAKEDDPSATFAPSLSGKFTATATDGSGKTVDVDITATNISLENSTEEVFYTKSAKQTAISCSASIGSVSKVVVVSDQKMKNSNYALWVKFSTDGTKWNKADFSGVTVAGDAAPYTNTVTNDNDDYMWFSIEPDMFAITGIYSFEVTFIAD